MFNMTAVFKYLTDLINYVCSQRAIQNHEIEVRLQSKLIASFNNSLCLINRFHLSCFLTTPSSQTLGRQQRSRSDQKSERDLTFHGTLTLLGIGSRAQFSSIYKAEFLFNATFQPHKGHHAFFPNLGRRNSGDEYSLNELLLYLIVLASDHLFLCCTCLQGY